MHYVAPVSERALYSDQAVSIVAAFIVEETIGA